MKLSTTWRGRGGGSGASESGVRIQARLGNAMWLRFMGLWLQDCPQLEWQGPALEERPILKTP